jgi:arabinoxylan arabinofuranohydrolase
MKPIHSRQLFLVVVTVVTLASISVSADYPVMSHRLLADPASLVYGGRVYLYTSNDNDNTNHSYQMKSIVCVSSVDMKNWTDHGEVFRVPQGASWAANSWAPSVIDRNGLFYLYFGNGAA